MNRRRCAICNATVSRLGPCVHEERGKPVCCNCWGLVQAAKGIGGSEMQAKAQAALADTFLARL